MQQGILSPFSFCSDTELKKSGDGRKGKQFKMNSRVIWENVHCAANLLMEVIVDFIWQER